MANRKMLQISQASHAMLKAKSKRTGTSMYQLASDALEGACGDDLERVGYLLREFGVEDTRGDRLDVLAYVLGRGPGQ